MKAIILISSIFYILGLKISNKIDLIKKSTPVEKVIIHSVQKANPEKTADFEEVQVTKKGTEAVKENSDCKDTE